MKKCVNRITGFLLCIVAGLYICSCKGRIDPLPSANNSSFIPGTTCALSEIKYFSNDDDSLIGGVQFKYSGGSKLSNVLYYRKGQQPGDNGYTTLLYNEDESLKEILTYSPPQEINFAGITATVPTQNFLFKYSYEAGRLIKVEQSFNTINSVFIDSSANGAASQYNYGYHNDGNLQYKVAKYVLSIDGFTVNYRDSTLFENYLYKRPQNVSQFTKILSLKGDTIINDLKIATFRKYVYDERGNKIKNQFLHFKIDSVDAAAFGQSANDIESLVDSIQTDVETIFDHSKPNVSYAFRYLNPENPDDIDANLPISSRSGCISVNSNYTFNTSGLPDKLYASFTFDGECKKLGTLFDKLNGFFGKSLPINNTYAKYYYTGCK